MDDTTWTITNILAKLNNYRGQNIWQDVIYSFNLDEDATDEVDTGRNDVFGVILGGTRTFFHYDPQSGEWHHTHAS